MGHAVGGKIKFTDRLGADSYGPRFRPVALPPPRTVNLSCGHVFASHILPFAGDTVFCIACGDYRQAVTGTKRADPRRRQQ
jgi:hypothetical protein